MKVHDAQHKAFSPISQAPDRAVAWLCIDFAEKNGILLTTSTYMELC